ncbi:MAG: hypothetical protein Q9195_001621 [Heterodermia aff. obscurata]
MEQNFQQDEYAGEAATNRAKRRKLDSRQSRYGYQGEVVPGPLQMRIISCDGGYHQDSINEGQPYEEDNILRNNKTVYCTYKNRCNIVLGHEGEAPFTVRKIIIKAPPRGYTSPIQEGLIFISMDDATDLLNRTEQYRIMEESPPPPAYAYHSLGSENGLPPHLRAVHAPSTVDELSAHIRANNYTSTGRLPPHRAEAISTLSAPPITNPDLDGANPTLGLPRARSRMIVDRNGIRRLYPDEEETNLVRIGLDGPARDHPPRRGHGHGAAERAALRIAANRRNSAAPSPRHRPRPSPYASFSNNAPPNLNPTPLTQPQRSAASRLSLTQSAPTSSTSPAPPASPGLPQQDTFTVTMDCSDVSEDDEEPSSPDVLADLYRRNTALYMNHSLDMEDESDDADETGITRARALRDRHTTLGAMQGLGRREFPSRVQVVDLADLDNEEEQDGGNGSQCRSERRRTEKERKGLLLPHARFFIEKEKSSVSITFEPEV